MKRKNIKDANYNVRVATIRDFKVLMIGRWNNKEEYRLEFPGGNIEKNDSRRKTGKKETKHEAGIDIIIEEELCRIRNNYNGAKNMLFLARMKRPDKTLKLEDGFTRAVWIHSENYFLWKYNHSGKVGVEYLMKNGYLI